MITTAFQRAHTNTIHRHRLTKSHQPIGTRGDAQQAKNFVDQLMEIIQ